MKRSALLKAAIIPLAAAAIIIGSYTLPGVYRNYKNSKSQIITIQEVTKPKTTLRGYERNLMYIDFSQIPEQTIVKEKIPLPKDLEGFISDKWNRPTISNREMFLEDFYEQAFKLGYDDEKFKNMGIKEAIQASVDIVASRMTYEKVDNKDNWFAQKYGRMLNTEDYFHHGFGDCDKYRNATMAAFDIIKKDNPNLQNVYLSKEELGGSMSWHAWVSVIIPQKDCLIISHIDPTFYDSGEGLEAIKDGYDSHVIVYNDAFKAYFYKELKEYEFACELFKESFYKTQDSDTLEKLLDDMCTIASWIRCKEKAIENVEWARKEYETRGFTENLDDILYYSYKTYSDAGDKQKAEECKQRLFEKFPDGYWTRLVKKEKN